MSRNCTDARGGNRRWRAALGVWMLVVGCAASPHTKGAQAEPVATAQVQRFQQALISAMKSRERLDFQARFERLSEVVVQGFDLDYMARLVIGRDWRGLSAAQREEFRGEFQGLMVSAFAAQVGVFAGEAFKFDAFKPLRTGRVLVRSLLARPDADASRFDYVLHEKAGRWLIINLVVDGVSDLALKRSEYGGLIASSGFKSLIVRIRAQTEAYRSEP
ncbi:MAG: phospholipid transport system substrate-binding protein [Gammaproteobacteria bacterium]|jgi:phospholipid transport system substrate-binding protein